MLAFESELGQCNVRLMGPRRHASILPGYANDHQHIIPFFGISRTPTGLGFVTLLCENGEILDYIGKHKQYWALLNSEAKNRIKLVGALIFSFSILPTKEIRQVTDIAKGLAQLHSLNRCHGFISPVCTSFSLQYLILTAA